MAEGMPRRVVKSVLSVEQKMGDSTSMNERQSIGSAELQNLDPFLLLDEFNYSAPGGISDHAHRGFEAVTYLLSGSSVLEDFTGRTSVLNEGDLQWVTVGRGVVHCEKPKDSVHGLQLWVNLAREHKMTKLEIQGLKSQDIPQGQKDGVSVKVIAGEALGIKTTLRTRTPTAYLDFTMQKGAQLRQPVTKGFTSFVYVLSGKAHFGSGTDIKLGEPHCTLVLSDGDFLQVENKEDEPCRFVLISGKPLNEPIVWHDNFVMNTDEEIQQTLSDLKNGCNGFEKAKSWKSELFHS